MNMCVCTAWDSEIELLTSLNPSLIELDRRKTRRRHRVTAALTPRKSCFLPCNADLHASSASLKHGLPQPSFFEWCSFLAHRLVVITHAIVKLRCKKETVGAGVNLAGKDRTQSCSRFPFLSFFLCCGSFFEDRSVRNGYCWAWLQRTRASSCHQDAAWCWCWEYARVEWAFRAVQRSQWNKEKTEMRKW